MAFDTDDDAVARPGKKPRGFPFRLWLFAILMTGLAGVAAWQYWVTRERKQDMEKQFAACGPQLQTTKNDLATTQAALTEANTNLSACSDTKKQTDAQLARMGKDLNASQDELTALRAQRAEAEKRMRAIADIQAQFAKMIDTGQLQVTARRGSLVVELPAEVLFPSGSAELSEKGKLSVLEVGFILKKFPDRRFLIVGHTDNVTLKGSVNHVDNWQLSTARALTVTRVLAQAGMKEDSIIPAGGGEYDPIAKNDTPQGRGRNRRIEIQLLPALSELPPLPASLEKKNP
jgi:chemotaxis protein MotB